MADPTQTVRWENVPSPFCGIANDDLVIETHGTDLKVVAHGCAITTPGFEQPMTDTQPRVGGQPCDLATAVERAAQLIANAHLPVMSGFGTDVNGTRAALSLADRSRAVFDQARAEGGLRNLLVLADSGWLTTTLAEVKNRVDLLLVFGTDIEPDFPRFFERFVWPPEAMFSPVAKREVVFLGKPPSGSGSTAPDGRAPEVIPCDTADLPAVAAALRALARGATLQAESVGGIPLDRLRGLIDRLRQAHYGVVTWAAGQLKFPQADLTIQQLCQCVVDLNKTTRCAALPLGGQDGDRTASQVCAWITGYPTRVSFARGFPEYDPLHHSALKLLASGEADLLIWVASINALQTPPSTAIPTVVIGRSGMRFEREPEVYIPVGTPGIDHAGHTFRCDSVVSLPLRKLRDSGLPSAAEVLTQIELKLAAQ